ncbi:hypothetical protein KIW84_058092 [Lathyrus oleraceus]|uniref:Uncharacterized protein n=1 Tax=Pisum sativum TaxID=3888 RepID=A0A9D5ANV5_PEA|nr:hypothetical protein KIW84_058092 [Pisum sativum]
MRPVQTPTHSRHYSLFQKTAVNSTTRSLSSLFCKGSSLSSILAPGKFSCYSKHSATNRGVLVVSPAGNEGILSSATNLAPWMLIVAVSSTDRDLTSVIMIGNGAKATGENLSLFEMNALSRIISAFQAFAGYFTPFKILQRAALGVLDQPAFECYDNANSAEYEDDNHGRDGRHGCLCSNRTGPLTATKILLRFFAKGVDTETVVLMMARASRLENQDAIDTAIVVTLANPREARVGV